MSETTTPRTEVLTSSFSYASAAVACRELNYSVAYSQGDPPVPPEQDLADRFLYALQAITSQDWQGFAQDCASTVADHPVDFGLFLVAGVCEYIIEQLKQLGETGMAIIQFVGDYVTCVRDIGHPLTTWDIDAILNSDACAPFHDAAMAMLSLEKFLNELRAMGVAGVLELAREIYPVALEVFEKVLEEGLVMLGDKRDAVEAWMRATAHDAEELGHMIGTVVAMVLIEIATEGIGTALKTSRWVSKLPGAGLILGVAESRTMMGVAPDGTLVVVEEARLAVAVRPLSAVQHLDELAEVFFQILRRNHKRFSKNLSMAKLRVLRKFVPASALKRFAHRRQQLFQGLASGFRRYKGRVRRYGDSVTEVQIFNRRVLTFHYADAALDEDIDYFGLLARKDAILPNIFEANHIVEERMFHARRGAWSAEMRKLGWSSPADMEAVLMSADEHTGSVRRMLERYGLTPAEVDGLEPPKSITRTLLDKIKLREEVNSSLPADVLIVEHDTPFIDVMKKYAALYKEHSPELWDTSLRSQFNGWRKALGLSEPIFR